MFEGRWKVVTGEGHLHTIIGIDLSGYTYYPLRADNEAVSANQWTLKGYHHHRRDGEEIKHDPDQRDIIITPELQQAIDMALAKRGLLDA